MQLVIMMAILTVLWIPAMGMEWLLCKGSNEPYTAEVWKAGSIAILPGGIIFAFIALCV